MDNPSTNSDQPNTENANYDASQDIPVDPVQPIPQDKPSDCSKAENRTKFHPTHIFRKWKNARLDRRWNKRKSDSARWTDKTIVFLTVGIVFLAYMQWREMHDSGKQTDRIIAADERLATAMEGTVAQAASGLSASINISRTDQRAWVGIGYITGVFQAGQKLWISVNIINSGKTPAINTNSTSVAEIVPRGKKPHFSHPPEVPFQIGTINPSGGTTGIQFSEFILDADLPAIFEKKQKTVMATDQIISAITTGEALVYVHGRLDYLDIYKQHHWTEWCSYFREGHYAACSEHNGTDDEKDSPN